MSTSEIKLDAIIPAGGLGSRMGAGVNKLFLKLKGIPILYRTLFRLNLCSRVERIILVLREDDRGLFGDMIKTYGALSKIAAVASGGEERAASVRNGLKYIIKHPKSDLVLVHDGARPFFSYSLIDNLAKKAIEKRGVAVPALQIVETVRRKQNETSRVVDRDSLFVTQTPQVFGVERILPCFLSKRQRNLQLTDEASYFEAMGLPVSLIEGEKWNIKITNPEDLNWAELLLDFYPQLKIDDYNKSWK